MRKLFVTGLMALCLGVSAMAQTDPREEVMANIDLTGGTYSMYPTGQPSTATAPKGYKPFYISHMGRHGARYAQSDGNYEGVMKTLAAAHEKGNLTAEGEKIYEAYSNLFPKLHYRQGNLTVKGQMQHRQIASQIYRDYPALFKGKTRAKALSTASHRVIVSMMCFLDQLKTLDPDLQIELDYGRQYYSMLVPESSESPTFVPRVPFPEETLRIYDEFAKECIDEEPILRRWFKNPDDIGMSKSDFFFNMQTNVFDANNLDFAVSDTLMNVFTDEERYGMWRIQSYSDYLYTARAPGIDIHRCLEMSVTAKDFIDRYEEDVKDGVALRLRFSHDTALMPLLSYLGVNGMDISSADPHEVEKVWRNYAVPMGCNFQLVFWRNKKGDVLIQPLLNGFQATLPLPEAAPGFYHWDDFKARFNHIEI